MDDTTHSDTLVERRQLQANQAESKGESSEPTKAAFD
jgi:hypothetical protein